MRYVLTLVAVVGLMTGCCMMKKQCPMEKKHCKVDCTKPCCMKDSSSAHVHETTTGESQPAAVVQEVQPVQ
jgi:hypothetical protein